MSIFRAPQVILFSDDLPRAVAFYTRLGFTETFRVPTEGVALQSVRTGPASRVVFGVKPKQDRETAGSTPNNIVRRARPGCG